MRILLLSFYFEPDLSAGSFRSTALVRVLQKRLGDGDLIDVLTTQPNRYQSYARNAAVSENTGNVLVTRFPLPLPVSRFP